jgi:hypothetical protein
MNHLNKLTQESGQLPGPLMMQVCIEDELGENLAPAPVSKAASTAERMRRYRARKILYRQLLRARSLGVPLSDAINLLHAAWQENASQTCPPRFSP